MQAACQLPVAGQIDIQVCDSRMTRSQLPQKPARTRAGRAELGGELYERGTRSELVETRQIPGAEDRPIPITLPSLGTTYQPGDKQGDNDDTGHDHNRPDEIHYGNTVPTMSGPYPDVTFYDRDLKPAAFAEPARMRSAASPRPS